MADLGVQQIGDRRFDGFVVFREGTLDEVGGIELGHPLGDHDESAEGVRRRIGLVVRHVPRPDPSVPAHGGARWIPWFAVRVGRGPVVHDAPVGRPVPRPVGIKPEARGVLLPAPGHHVAGLGKRPRIEPVAAGGRAAGLEGAEARQLLALRVAPVDLAGHFGK